MRAARFKFKSGPRHDLLLLFGERHFRNAVPKLLIFWIHFCLMIVYLTLTNGTGEDPSICTGNLPSHLAIACNWTYPTPPCFSTAAA